MLTEPKFLIILNANASVSQLLNSPATAAFFAPANKSAEIVNVTLQSTLVLGNVFFMVFERFNVTF
jgi:hypothetical protein